MAKSTDAEITLRINTVAEMLIKGMSRAKIVRYTAETWQINSRQTDEYISRAYSDIKNSADKDKEKNVALAMARFTDLYEKNYKIQDYRECRQVQAELNKLLGVYEAEINQTNNITVTLRD